MFFGGGAVIKLGDEVLGSIGAAGAPGAKLEAARTRGSTDPRSVEVTAQGQLPVYLTRANPRARGPRRAIDVGQQSDPLAPAGRRCGC